MEYEQFSSQVAPHAAAMARVAAALVGMDDAEDAAQEALLRAWQHWPTLREVDAVRTWLLRITVNVCRNWQSGHFGTTRRRTGPLDPAVHDGARDWQSDELQATNALDVRRAIALLPHDLRRVVALRFYAGMNSAEIGDVLDVPAATVRTRLRRALELLREGLSGETSTTTSTTIRREGIPNG